MNFSIAVDFTASNGDPSDYRSLHFMNPQTMENQYTTAIRSVGEIVQDYDTDKQFPALGFGARIPPQGQVSHEFFLNLSQDNNPYCAGVDGLDSPLFYFEEMINYNYFTVFIYRNHTFTSYKFVF